MLAKLAFLVGTLLQQFHDSRGAIRCIEIHPTTSDIWTAGADGQIRIYRLVSDGKFALGK